jgi:hypothetical protein
VLPSATGLGHDVAASRQPENRDTIRNDS